MKNLPASLNFNDRELTVVSEKKLQVLDAMEHHVLEEKERILEQAKLLHEQLELIEKREDLARMIYNANYSFEPVFLKKYSLYKKNNTITLSLIGPNEWTGICPFGEFINYVRQLGDATWEIVD